MQSEKLRLAGEIAAGVAHEIRNPMTVISSFVQMMQADENSPYKSYVEIVQDEIERIDLIISEFLVLSKPQIKDKEWVNLIEIIQNISAFYQLEFQAKSIYFELIYSIDEAFIYGNKNQLKQVFINLIKNAMEAIDHNGAIKITLSKQESSYLITIQDNGSGISDEILNRIFEPFYTTKTKGTGLGMMITNKIVQDHFGSIKVFSKENVGTDVHIQFAFNQQI
jgi:signal transduction histidine kinase